MVNACDIAVSGANNRDRCHVIPRLDQRADRTVLPKPTATTSDNYPKIKLHTAPVDGGFQINWRLNAQREA